jgi:crossover junction endodeoxyribonuclease RuvC
MRILGVDPGLRTTGYGVVEVIAGRFRLIEGGVLRPKVSLSLEARLAELHAAILDVVRTTRPDCMVVEELWSAPKHPLTGVLMGHARGVIALAAGLCDVTFEELSHVTVKRALTGNGAARKDQVKAMVCVQLGLTVSPEPNDVTDALALALVYGMRGLTPATTLPVMERAPRNRAQLPESLRARLGGGDLRSKSKGASRLGASAPGGAEPGAERL